MTSFAFETTDQTTSPTAEQLAEADSDTAILSYTNGLMKDGTPYYAYIAVKPSRYSEFNALTSARCSLVLGEYGTIIASGFEAEPPPDVVKAMREIYGFDDEYEYKLVQIARAKQKKQEETRLQGIVDMLKRQIKPNGSGNPV